MFMIRTPASSQSLPETKLLNEFAFLVNATAVRAVARQSQPKDDDHGLDDRGPAPLRAGHPGDGPARHAGPVGGDHRCHPPAIGGGPTAGLAHPGHAPGLVARGARRSRLATTAASLAAAPDGMEPPLRSWRRRAVLERALRVVVACRRLA